MAKTIPSLGFLLGFCALGLAACCPSAGLSQTVRIPQIQGRGHTSPLVGEPVREVAGIVTAIDPEGEDRGFWMQDPYGDGDAATSDGLFVAADQVSVAVGQTVTVSGTVEEAGRDGDLTTTRLRAGAIRSGPAGQALPPPVLLGLGGRRPPAELIDDDGLQLFEPELDGIDFYESLEGMRVKVRDALVVGPTSRFGEIVVVADGGKESSISSHRGGLVLRPGDDNPERLLIGSRLLADPPAVHVGDRFTAVIVGVVDYSFSNFKIQPAAALPPVVPAPPADEATELRPTARQLTLATFNVLNLSARDPPEKFTRLAAVITGQLANPDVLALQEVQDASGGSDDGVVDATATFEALIRAVEAAGGPRYDFRQIDPLNNADGGRPGGNIRVGYLFHPGRVTFVDRGRAGARDVTAAEAGSVVGGHGRAPLQLSLSPGRIAPEDPAFERSRKPLAGELLFRGRRIFLINAHLRSKGGDEPLMGRRQPPRRLSESQRSRQAREIHRFMESLLAVDPEARVVVLGDMNEMEFRPPMQVLSGGPWVNLLEPLARRERYTYIYQGNSQVLDHILISPALAERAAPEIDIVHVNADFADGRRASDHDPVLIRLTFD